MAGANCVEIAGRLIELERLRHTPAGIPMVRFRISHESLQHEAGVARIVNCELEAVAVEREAYLIASAQLGIKLATRGFLDRKNRNSAQLVLHATHIEFEDQD